MAPAKENEKNESEGAMSILEKAKAAAEKRKKEEQE